MLLQRSSAHNATLGLLLASMLVATCARPAAGPSYWTDEARNAEVRCQNGVREACTQLGRYLIGDQGRTDSEFERGLVLLEVACADDEVGACATLGGVYKSRGPAARDRARHLLTYACGRRSPEGCTWLGEELAKPPAKDSEGAKKALRAGCDLGDARGCELYGLSLARSDFHKDDALAQEAFGRACRLGSPSGCRSLAHEMAKQPSRRREALALLSATCLRATDAPSCADAAWFVAPLVGLQPSCGGVLPFAGIACAANNGSACAMIDACNLPSEAQRAGALERLRTACEGDVALACLYWADGTSGARASGDAERTRAYDRACRAGGSVSRVACPRFAIATLDAARIRVDADEPLEALRNWCRTSSGEACCALANEYTTGRWVATEPDRAAELRAKACELGTAACCSGH